MKNNLTELAGCSGYFAQFRQETEQNKFAFSKLRLDISTFKGVCDSIITIVDINKPHKINSFTEGELVLITFIRKVIKTTIILKILPEGLEFISFRPPCPFKF